jgi:hypothetical protein
LEKKKVCVTLDSVKGCPCMVCEDIDKCFESGVKDPVECKTLMEWIASRKPE